jgi:hypothetical protein
MAFQGYKKGGPMALKQFISEFGLNFSDSMKEKLMELESRSYLTKLESENVFDLKHVEHIQYECLCDSSDTSSTIKKEYSYAQFQVNDGILYFSEICMENKQVTQSPMVTELYNSLDDEGIILINGRGLKKVDDKNISLVVNSILSACPQVSQAYLDIIKGMVSRADNKNSVPSTKAYTWGKKFRI